MAAIRRPSAPAMSLSINVARMIVVVRVPGIDRGKSVSACSRPQPDSQA
jgi:hypothetical protein